ncbi:MAG: elongation factor 1-beta [Candidatus Nanoarchaeia archaeon]|nr:elongation factor 1-beta [Candidatus Nanoarchaeia archaeon]
MAATLVVSYKIMASDPDVDMEELVRKVTPVLTKYGIEYGKHSVEPVAFGLKALILHVLSNDDIGTPEELENELEDFEEIENVQVIQMQRALG